MMKRLTALFLLLVMIAAMVSPSIAATREPEVSPQACYNHDYRLVSSDYVWKYYDVNLHRYYRVDTYVCRVCGSPDQEPVGLGQYQEHNAVYVSASCNGTTQTHNMRCNTCATSYSRTVRCINAPHSGSCTVLPV